MGAAARVTQRPCRVAVRSRLFRPRCPCRRVWAIASSNPMPDPVDVAVAVLLRGDGAVLLARRPRGKVYAGYWEFPGGKIEAGEPGVDALRGENPEKPGVGIQRGPPRITRAVSHPHASLRP